MKKSELEYIDNLSRQIRNQLKTLTDEEVAKGLSELQSLTAPSSDDILKKSLYSMENKNRQIIAEYKKRHSSKIFD